MVASQYLAVHITGFAEGSLVVMYEVSLKESVPGGLLGRELETALTESPVLTVREGSLSVAPGKYLFLQVKCTIFLFIYSVSWMTLQRNSNW